jgi:predicted amidohydrolase YtcJ
MLLESTDRHQQLLMHIIGDNTTEISLDAMDATGGPRQWSGKRVRIEHGCGLAPDLLSAGIPLAIGSDGLLNPYVNIMFAVMHPMRPNEGLTREQAVIAYTGHFHCAARTATVDGVRADDGRY